MREGSGEVAEELDVGDDEQPLSLPTPSFVASAEEE